MKPLYLLDFFCGGGGTTKGMRDAGIIPVFGYDKEEKMGKTYNANNPTSSFVQKDFHDPPGGPYGDLLEETYGVFAADHALTGDDFIFAGSPPCQPFSPITTRRKNKRDADLVWKFLHYVRMVNPAYVLIENVSGIQRASVGLVPRIVGRLGGLGYSVNHGIVYSCDYGVPQVRKRYLILASRVSGCPFPFRTHSVMSADTLFGEVKPYNTVRDAITKYPPHTSQRD